MANASIIVLCMRSSHDPAMNRSPCRCFSLRAGLCSGASSRTHWLAHTKTYLLTLFSCNQVRYLLRLIINRGKRSAFRRCVFPDRQSGVLGCSEAARSQRRHTMRPSGMISPHITQRSSEKYIMASSFSGGEIRLTVRRISPLFVTAQIAKSDGGS